MIALYVILAVIALLIIITAIRAAKFVPEKKERPEMVEEKVNFERVQKNLSKAIQCKTVSHDDPSLTDWSEFEKFHAFLEEAYPQIHSKLEKEVSEVSKQDNKISEMATEIEKLKAKLRALDPNH